MRSSNSTMRFAVRFDFASIFSFFQPHHLEYRALTQG